MSIRYIPDSEFHEMIVDRLAAEGSIGADNQEERDLFITETMLAVENVWPETWKGLMTDQNKDRLILKVLAERRARRH